MVDFEKKLFQFILSYIFDHVIKKYFLYSFFFYCVSWFDEKIMILLTSHILSNFLMISLRKPQHLCNLDYTVSSYYYPLLPPPYFLIFIHGSFLLTWKS